MGNRSSATPPAHSSLKQGMWGPSWNANISNTSKCGSFALWAILGPSEKGLSQHQLPKWLSHASFPLAATHAPHLSSLRPHMRIRSVLVQLCTPL